MNGDKAEVCANIISSPKITKTIMIGSNQNFFRTRKNSQISRMRDQLPLIQNLPSGTVDAPVE
jgi:hypothetical protein